MKRAIAAGTATGFMALTLAAAPALAQEEPAPYPPTPAGSCEQTATTVPAGSPVTFTCIDFATGATVTFASTGVAADGSTITGPSTTVTANSPATASLTFSQAGTYDVTATGEGPDGVGEVTAKAAPVTVTAKGGGGASGGGATGGGATGGGALATTGASNNTLTIAAVGGGLLLAGVGAVAVARRREHSN
jgi:LPXTG-motif cell wall-anchored protein